MLCPFLGSKAVKFGSFSGKQYGFLAITFFQEKFSFKKNYNPKCLVEKQLTKIVLQTIYKKNQPRLTTSASKISSCRFKRSSLSLTESIKECENHQELLRHNKAPASHADDTRSSKRYFDQLVFNVTESATIPALQILARTNKHIT